MRLRFIGRDGSLGLRHGQVYRLSVRPWREDGVYITFPVPCPYDTDEAFWRNWEIPQKPCGGNNSNVCVAEGCYAESCIKEEKP
jgi:hypothetical protein